MTTPGPRTDDPTRRTASDLPRDQRSDDGPYPDLDTADGRERQDDRLDEDTTTLRSDPAVDEPLVGDDDATRFGDRWRDVQAAFVDDPRSAVAAADGLVGEVVQAVAARFGEHRQQLERSWKDGGEPDTEQLRQALQRYRGFFDRLLTS